MRVLIMDSDLTLSNNIEIMLSAHGFNVTSACCGADGLELAKIYGYDLVLLDFDLPDMNGLEALRHLRMAKVDSPVIILADSPEVDIAVRAFSGGADDYVAKPFHQKELVARMRAVARRFNGHAQSIIRTGELMVNLDTQKVAVNGQRIHLTSKEYQILELLVLRRGAALSKEMLLNHLYGGMDEPEPKIIDVFVCKLRKKLGSAAGQIETVWGRGYMLREPDVTIGHQLPMAA
jgi:two-component system cell cycle response regulator CtrA